MSNKTEISTQIKEGMKEGLNLQEISWCETYLRTLSIKQACTESGLKVNEANQMLLKESVVSYIMMRSDQYRQALKIEKEQELDRDKISKVLTNMILDPLTNPELKLRAISQLNGMKEFDKKENIESEDENQKVVEPKLNADEAEDLLKIIREKNRKKKL